MSPILSAKYVVKPKRPADLPHGRWLSDFGNLTNFEKDLVYACRNGSEYKQYLTPKFSEKGDLLKYDIVEIRATLIRFLALGGDNENPVHENGIRISGCCITGELNLNNSENICAISLKNCTFPEKISINNSKIVELILDGSSLSKGFSATSSYFKGSLLATRGFKNEGEFDIAQSKIGRDLDFQGSTLNNPDGICLNANGSIINGNVYLSAVRSKIDHKLYTIYGKLCKFESSGTIHFFRSHVFGDMILLGGEFKSNNKKRAFKMINTKIEKCLYFFYHGEEDKVNDEKANIVVDGHFKFEGSTVYSISDSKYTWNGENFSYDLHGLTYTIFVSNSPLDSESRKKWLLKQKYKDDNEKFFAQPWEQLIKVLREMGYPDQASEIAIAKQDTLRTEGKVKGWLRRPLHWIYGKLVGYGHRPQRMVYTMIFVCMFCALAFYCGRAHGMMGPSSPLIHASASFDHCGVRGDPHQYDWTSVSCQMPPEYTSFQPFFYSLDLILPLVDLQQDSDWSPIVSNANGKTLWAGRALRWLMWFEILFGWVASLTLVAVVGRLVEKD